MPFLRNTKDQVLSFYACLLKTKAIRNARAEYSVEPAKRISASIVASEEVNQYISVSINYMFNMACGNSVDPCLKC